MFVEHHTPFRGHLGLYVQGHRADNLDCHLKVLDQRNWYTKHEQHALYRSGYREMYKQTQRSTDLKQYALIIPSDKWKSTVTNSLGLKSI